MLLGLMIIIACCIAFATPIEISLILVGLIFWAAIGYNAKYGCLGRIFDIILLIIGAIFIVIGFCLI